MISYLRAVGACPRDGAIIFSDLTGKLDVLRVSCEKCGRDGCYGLNRLIEKRGRDAKLVDWLDELTAECPKKDCPQHERHLRCEVPATVESVVIVRKPLIGTNPHVFVRIRQDVAGVSAFVV